MASKWAETVEEFLVEVQEQKFDGKGEGEKCLVVISEEYTWWCQRCQKLEAMKKQLALPAILRAFALLENIDSEAADLFSLKCAKIEVIN